MEYQCCPLAKTRKNIVFIRGTGDRDVDVLFVGEAPGKDEDELGLPFVGRSGKLLDKWIKEMEINNYAIVNIVKCRPPGNRKPTNLEIYRCMPLLEAQLNVLRPKLIVALGGVAATVLINRKIGIMNDIGKVFKTIYGRVIIFPHPSYITRGKKVDLPFGKIKELLIETF